MILKELQLFSEFRGLPTGYKILFNQVNDVSGEKENDVGIEPICLVGLNGSGKSNILEVLAEIFYYLETYHRLDRNKRGVLSEFKTDFGFKVKYFIQKNVVLSSKDVTDDLIAMLSDTSEDPLITITKKKKEYPEIVVELSSKKIVLKNNNNNRDASVLPARVIGYSSGMNELLSNPFVKIDLQYFEDLRNKTNEAFDAKLDMNRLFFMDYDSNRYITVSNFLFDADDFDMSIYRDNDARASDYGGINLTFLKKATCINDLAYFTVSLKLEKLNSDDYEYLPSELNLALHKFKACATFCEESQKIAGKNIIKEIRYDYWVNKATKEAFREQFGTAYELFRSFYFLRLLNTKLVGVKTRKRISSSKSGDIENLSDELPKFEKSKLVFSLYGIKLENKSGNKIEYRELSDGEHQLLQIVGNLLLMDTDGALFLYDEPETHFNPGWRSKFVQLVSKSIDKTRRQELILTTHSPFIVSDCKKENVFIFSRNKNGKVRPPETPDIKTFGTAVSILTDKIFKKEESISDKSLAMIENIRSMPLNSLEQILAAKEAAKVLGESVEKVMLFREIILKEEELKKNA